MEFKNLYYLLFTTLVFILIKLTTIRTSKPKLPPGPRKLPVIGNLHNLLRSGLPHHALSDLARIYGPIMHLKLGEVSTVVVTSREVTQEMLKTHDRNFSSRAENLAVKIMLYGGADMTYSPYGDFWRQLRKLFVTEMMSAKRVQSFQSIREDEALQLVQTIADAHVDAPVNLSELLHSFSNNLIARAAFGSKCKDGETFSKELKQSVELGSGFLAADLYPSWAFVIGLVTGMKSKLERCHRNVDKILERIIKEHKERKALQMEDGVAESREENFLDVLFRLQAQDGLGFQLTTTNIKAIIFDVFGAGSGSSASSLTWTMSELMRNPRVMQKTRAEIRQIVGEKANISENDIKQLRYLKLVIKESLRLHPPAPLLVPRESTKRCEISGYEIPAKTRVVFNAWAMGRDPMYWNEPEVFKPERFEGSSIDFNGINYEFIPFGAGRRMCPGISFGLAAMEAALAHLLYYFDWNLPQGMNDLDMSEAQGIGVRRKFDLMLCASPTVTLSSH